MEEPASLRSNTRQDRRENAESFTTNSIEVRQGHDIIIGELSLFVLGTDNLLSQSILDLRVEREKVKCARGCAARCLLAGKNQKADRHSIVDQKQDQKQTHFIWPSNSSSGRRSAASAVMFASTADEIAEWIRRRINGEKALTKSSHNIFALTCLVHEFFAPFLKQCFLLCEYLARRRVHDVNNSTHLLNSLHREPLHDFPSKGGRTHFDEIGRPFSYQFHVEAHRSGTDEMIA